MNLYFTPKKRKYPHSFGETVGVLNMLSDKEVIFLNSTEVSDAIEEYDLNYIEVKALVMKLGRKPIHKITSARLDELFAEDEPDYMGGEW